MGYHSTTGTANNTADFLEKLKDFLVTTVGWTLHDDGSGGANPYYVLKSTGESGMEDVYLQFLMGTTDKLMVRASLYWDNVAHSGVKEAYVVTYCYIAVKDASSFLYWFYADLDHIFAVTKIVSTYYGQYSGLLKRFWSGAVAITQEAVLSGSNVVVQVNDASIFSPGSYYLIKDNANIERVQISAIDTVSSPNTVTLASVAGNFALGAKIGEDPQPVIVGRFNSPGGFYALNKFDGYAGAALQVGVSGSADAAFATSTDPDFRMGLTTMFPWLAGHTAAAYSELRGEFIEIFQMGGGSADSEDILDFNGTTYKIFNLSGAGMCAIKE